MWAVPWKSRMPITSSWECSCKRSVPASSPCKRHPLPLHKPEATRRNEPGDTTEEWRWNGKDSVVPGDGVWGCVPRTKMVLITRSQLTAMAGQTERASMSRHQFTVGHASPAPPKGCSPQHQGVWGAAYTQSPRAHTCFSYPSPRQAATFGNGANT